MRRLLLIVLLAGLLIGLARPAAAAPAIVPGAAADRIRVALFDAQLSIPTDPAAAARGVAEAEGLYRDGLAPGLSAAAPGAHESILAGFDALTASAASGQAPNFAAHRAGVWTALLGGAYQAAEKAIQSADGPAAQAWLAVREFRTVTRFSRPNSDATLAASGLAAGTVTPDDALLALHADLLDTYQARLAQALRDLAAADTHGFAVRRAELAALAGGYFLILSPAYTQQRGPAAESDTRLALAGLRESALNGRPLASSLAAVEASLHNFRAAPLSAAEQSRRAGQLLRFLSLVPVEYARGVTGGRVTRDLEIQEAITFLAGARAAFTDLENLLDALDRDGTVRAGGLFDALAAQLAEAGQGTRVANPDDIQAQADALSTLLSEMMPPAWREGSTQADFDVIGALLDQMEAAAGSGDYALAESARLEAYAVMEVGPEARLMVFAPQLRLRLEDLFWHGPGPQVGLASLIKDGAPLRDIRATRAVLDESLAEAQRTLGVASAPAAVAANAGLIVFREGLEAVLILASLMSSLKGRGERRHRQAMWVGTAAALAATVLTWLVARDVLQRLARYGERLEAVVSLIAIGILLLITNWFFHKTYWTDWMAGFHARKRQLITGETGIWLGLVLLGFTSVYREGFETVLFLQALVLDSGAGSVLAGVAVALLAVLLVGLATFQLQVRLPHKRLLIVTGIFIGGVLLQMVGATTHVMQVVGWLPIHLVGVPLPFWLGTWFGIYPTWEGLGLQALAAAFVIGSYYLAERVRHAPDRRAVTA